MNIENYIESQIRELGTDVNEEYMELYQGINHPKLKIIFSTLHARFIALFKLMNSILPTGEYEAHYWADPSRNLISVIEMIEGLQRLLKNSQFSFKVDDYYQQLIDLCNKFLSRSGGSEIPPGMDKINLYYTLPIFLLQNGITVTNAESQRIFELRNIGAGSYAQVFMYNDEFYNKTFVVKRAKKDLNAKELERFRQEFIQMNMLKSPYIVEVFRYDDAKNEYIMENMDFSLYDYIQKLNTKLTISQRKNIGFQIIKAFSYIHSKQLLHRDISPKNILLKNYDDVVVVKVSDFGLVKVPDSNLTSANTEFKGCFNDPSLVLDGFSTYNILHETYALTRLLFYVMTGRTNTNKIDNQKLKYFVDKGLSPDKSLRFQNIEELTEAFKQI